MNKFEDCKKEVMEKAENELTKEIVQFITDCKKKKHAHSYLIAILHMIQDKFGFLAKDKLEAVAQIMQIPAAKISGVASFYHYFRLKPTGKFLISVCMGTACHVRGSGAVANKFKEELGIEFGETSKDNLFSLEAARCLGTCALAPVVKIGDDIYSQVTPDQVSGILEKYFKMAN
jgi:NADH:ubiquinone oxidoreductase subunit E